LILEEEWSLFWISGGCEFGFGFARWLRDWRIQEEDKQEQNQLWTKSKGNILKILISFRLDRMKSRVVELITMRVSRMTRKSVSIPNPNFSNNAPGNSEQNAD